MTDHRHGPRRASTAADDGQPIIETVGLTKTYPGTDFRAVDELNLSVGTGEVFGLARSERRRQDDHGGRAHHPGHPHRRAAPSSGASTWCAHPTLAKQLIGVVSQQNTLDRQLTPWENLYFHGRLFGMGARECRQTADDLLERFQLTRFAKASVYALSGGMAQRLMVARAIFHRPAVLFLDEPTAGLDPQGRLALWDLLARPQRRGPDDHADHPLHGRGRQALRPGGHHGPRQDPRPRHSGRAQAQRGRRHHRHRQGGGGADSARRGVQPSSKD